MNALWLSLGTLTRLPVPMPKRVDRTVAGWSLALSPLVGGVLAAVLGAAWWLADRAFPGVSPFLLAALLIGALAWLTRGIHLDGLADVADGLGSGRPADEALVIMKKSDIGPFGVVTLLLTLLVQVGALSQVMISFGTFGAGLVLLVALASSRGVLMVLGTRAYPPARDDGLGRTVAQSVTAAPLACGFLLLAAVVAGAVIAAGRSDLTDQGLLWLGVAGPVGMLGGLMRAITAQDRLGGVTGDVYGASVEIAFTTALLAAALGGSL
ncbi:adenosylcobinamide-GDP ribazoletransferase [Nocardioides daejeonensis]|uniref:adenosylcobinamide-GDP ribazoletransferase n=1 Tax=Nocardioides daejeonensis TaxID=1046556 RepID=UPI001950DD68|nr:adenosylcobinamide-GDP ribazoletransferase [Nocardioides daejeonensis]